MEKSFAQMTFAAFLSVLAYYAGIMAVPVTVLIFLMALDYLTGLAGAYINKELSSRQGVRGIIKKLCYLGAVAAAAASDWALAAAGLSSVYDNGCSAAIMVAMWLIINELISILENLSRIGIPLPEKLLELIKRLKNK